MLNENMKITTLIIMAFFMVLMTSCDTDKGKPTTDPALFAQKLTFPFNTPKVKGQAAITMLRDHVRDLILLRQRNQEGDLFDLTYYYITPRGFSNLDRRVGPDGHKTRENR